MDSTPFTSAIGETLRGKYPLTVTHHRELTRRAVLWVGLKCDVRCVFCYDENLSHKGKKWIPFEGAGGTKDAVETFRWKYKNRYIDFMGGEPTLYPHIYKLVQHCADIGLEPTPITHGMHLADMGRVKRFKDAGVHDFLVSIHGVGEKNDEIVRSPRGGVSQRQRKALENLNLAGIPFRFNVTLLDWNKEQLPQIAELGRDMGAQVINFLTFNPYFEWDESTEIPFQGRHSEIAPHLKRAIDICSSNGIEANVRYMPICQMKGYEQHIYTGYQLPYDTHEWDYNSWYDYSAQAPADTSWYLGAARDQQKRHNYVQGEACSTCALASVCDGFHAQYAARYGLSEASPYAGTPVMEPTHFVGGQLKYHYQRQVSDDAPQDWRERQQLALSQAGGDRRTRAGMLSPESEA